MATTGAKIAGTGTSVARGTNTAWTNPGNITANDGTVASCNSGTTGSAYLRASNFTFNIPANSLIQGFKVVVDMAESSAGSETVSVQLVGAAATAVGTAKTFTANGTALTLYTLGSGTDLWGTTGLTATDLNDTDFGVYVWYTTSHNTTVDYISIDVTYLPPVSGSFAPIETGSDTAAVNGKVSVSGSLAVTETGTDTASFNGKVVASVSGYLAATETGTDTAAISGTVKVSGSLAATETGSDTAALQGNVRVSGSLSATEVGQDTAVISGTVPISGALSATETDADVSAFLAKVLVSGSLAVDETGQDTASFSSNVPIPTPGRVGGLSVGPRRSIRLAAQRILTLLNGESVIETPAVKKLAQKLKVVVSKKKPDPAEVEVLAKNAITELQRQQKTAEYVRDAQAIRAMIDDLKSIQLTMQREAEDEEALMLLM